MKANELIQKQHRLVEELFERFEKARGAEKARVFEQIAKNLVAHDAIEREIFYPACEEAIDDDDILRESLVEHGVVEFCLFRADVNQGNDDFDKYVKVLGEVVMHHVKEEEKELLPKAKRALGRDQLEALGAELEARFDEALRSDFRAPLRDALDQVLAGKTKTDKRRTRGSANRGSASSSRSASSRSASRRNSASSRAQSRASAQ
jgi:hemerythrin superfamily protein